jgi:hypothetical protein
VIKLNLVFVKKKVQFSLDKKIIQYPIRMILQKDTQYTIFIWITMNVNDLSFHSLQ